MFKLSHSGIVPQSHGLDEKTFGPELLAECRTLNGCRTGEAKITKGYNLPAKHVIHTVGPIYSGSMDDPILLANCYQNALDLAKENALHSIAFPAISTGVYGYPKEEAATLAVAAVRAWLSQHAAYEIEVIFSCFDQRTADLYRQAHTAGSPPQARRSLI